MRCRVSVAWRVGSFGKPKTQGGIRGNGQANAALYRIVTVRMRWHQPTMDYVARRTAQGLSKRDIIRCLKRFVAREIYHGLLTDYRARHAVTAARAQLNLPLGYPEGIAWHLRAVSRMSQGRKSLPDHAGLILLSLFRIVKSTQRLLERRRPA